MIKWKLGFTWTPVGRGRLSNLVASWSAPARGTIFSVGMTTKQPSRVSRAAENSRSTGVSGMVSLFGVLPTPTDSPQPE